MMYTSLSSQAVRVLAVPQQVPQQFPSAGTGGATLIVVLLCAAIWYVIKHKGGKVLHIAMAFTAGCLLAGSVFGGIATQTASSLGGGLSSMLSTLGTGK
jgi:zinc transporter ZupT